MILADGFSENTLSLFGRLEGRRGFELLLTKCNKGEGIQE